MYSKYPAEDIIHTALTLDVYCTSIIILLEYYSTQKLVMQMVCYFMTSTIKYSYVDNHFGKLTSMWAPVYGYVFHALSKLCPVQGNTVLAYYYNTVQP